MSGGSGIFAGTGEAKDRHGRPACERKEEGRRGKYEENHTCGCPDSADPSGVSSRRGKPHPGADGAWHHIRRGRQHERRRLKEALRGAKEMGGSEMKKEQEQKMQENMKKEKAPKKKKWKKVGGIAVGVVVLLGFFSAMSAPTYEETDASEPALEAEAEQAEKTDAAGTGTIAEEAIENAEVTKAALAEEADSGEVNPGEGDAEGDDFYDYEAEPEDVVYKPFDPYEALPEDAVILSEEEFLVLEYRPNFEKVEAMILVYRDAYEDWYDSIYDIDPEENPDAYIMPENIIYGTFLRDENGVTAEPYTGAAEIYLGDTRKAPFQDNSIKRICDATGWYNKEDLDAEKEMYQKQWDEIQAERESLEAREAQMEAGWVPDGTSLKDILRRPEEYTGLKIQFGNCWVASVSGDNVLVAFGTLEYGGYDCSTNASVILTITENTTLADGRLLEDDWFTFNGTVLGVDQISGRLVVEGGFVDVLPNL